MHNDLDFEFVRSANDEYYSLARYIIATLDGKILDTSFKFIRYIINSCGQYITVEGDGIVNAKRYDLQCNSIEYFIKSYGIVKESITVDKWTNGQNER